MSYAADRRPLRGLLRVFGEILRPDVCFHHTSTISIWSRNAAGFESTQMCVYLCIQMCPDALSHTHTHSHLAVLCVGGLNFIRACLKDRTADCRQHCGLIGYCLWLEYEDKWVSCVHPRQALSKSSGRRDEQGLLHVEVVDRLAKPYTALWL